MEGFAIGKPGMKAIVTGSGGLIGSECARVLCEEGWDVIGIDNDMRQTFFGPAGSTKPIVNELIDTLTGYPHRCWICGQTCCAVKSLPERHRPKRLVHRSHVAMVLRESAESC